MMMAALDFEESSHNGQTGKRPGPSNTSSEPTKKRAPYAPRACDACRRRKGRCSGGNPCSYCFSRSLHCGGAVNVATSGYSYENVSNEHDDREAAGFRGLLTPAPSSSSRKNAQLPTHHADHDTASHNRGYVNSVRSYFNTVEEVPDQEYRALPMEELIANLQDQIGTLTSRLRLVESKSGSDNHAESQTSTERPRFDTSLSCSDGNIVRQQESPRQRLATKAVHRKRFCGPTSPDYSLNVAQIRLYQGSLGGIADDRRPRLPSIDDNQSDDEESLDGDENETTSGIVSGRSLERLTGFRRLLSKDDAGRLIQTYREVFHCFHPILDINTLARQVEVWYDQPQRGSNTTTIRYGHSKQANTALTPSTDEITLLSINLVLAIALCAEPSSDVDIGKAIYAYCREAIHHTTICPAPDLNNAVIALLVGTYHFFRDQLRFAWRMAGMAGVILLELGLHSRDFPEHLLGPECDRSQVIAIICTTIVLDRQWSAATGLPTHFQESHFKSAMKSSVESPYLKAMVSFMAVSDKFTSAMAQRASSGEPSEEDDSFDIINFQIEQWRRNSLGRYNMAPGSAGASLPLDRIPSWAILLNLRANAAHSMLLRPFFFSNKPTDGSRRNLEPALRFFSDTINILGGLDKSTNVYRMQLPFYVHLLASACALMSLVIVHVAQNRAALSQDLSKDFVDTMCRTFRKAMDLASRHASTSRASQKLLKRMTPIGRLLSQMGSGSTEKTNKVHKPSNPGDGKEDPRQASEASRRSTRPQRNQDSATTTSNNMPAPMFQHTAVDQIPERSQAVMHDVRNSIDHNMYYTTDQSLMQTMQPFMMMDVGDTSTFASDSPNDHMPPFGHGNSGLGEWPLVGGNAFFSEGELLFDE